MRERQGVAEETRWGMRTLAGLGTKGNRFLYGNLPHILDKGLSPGAVQLATCSEPRGVCGWRGVGGGCAWILPEEK